MNSNGRASEAYKARNYDRILVQFPRGARDKLKALAAAEGISVNRYILSAVEQKSGLHLTLDNALEWIGQNRQA